MQGHAITRWAIVAILGLSCPASAVADTWKSELQGLADRGAWAELVEKLGDDRYQVRELAHQMLLDAGQSALSAVETGRTSRDPETALRCLQILSIMERYHLRAELAEFENQYDPSIDYRFPAWRAFKAISGDSPAARSMFVMMQRDESRLLQAVDGNQTELRRIVDARFQQMSRTNVSSVASSASVLSLLLADLVAARRGAPAVNQSSAISRLFGRVRSLALTKGKHGEPTEKLLNAWVTATVTTTNYYPLLISVQNGLQGGLPAARRLLRENSRSSAAWYALCNVYAFGDWETDKALLTELLDRKDMVTRRTRTIQGVRRSEETQVRDLALAALVKLSKRSHADFGQPSVRVVNGLVNYAGFTQEDNRQAAIAKWRAFQNPELPSPSDRAPAPAQPDPSDDPFGDREQETTRQSEAPVQTLDPFGGRGR